MNVACAIYTRKSSEEGLEQSFNSLDAQREACEAFILSQKAQGWKASKAAYDDGGFSGGNLQRPALQRLLADMASGRVQIVVVYKVDRLTRSLADFAKLVERFDEQGVSFVSVTQQFNTTSSMGRLTLNVLLSFAQFEREVTGERIRDKIAASKRKGMWMGGMVPVGYRLHERALLIDEVQADRVREMYRLYVELDGVSQLEEEINRRGWLTPARTTRRAGTAGDRPFSRGHLYRILSNPLYAGRIVHKGQVFEGQHPALVEEAVWQAVQDRMASHRQGHRTRRNARVPSLLAGLVFDAHGGRLTASHAKKGARRYRYYVSQEGTADQVLRLPAQEVESAVIQAVTHFLKDEGQVAQALGAADATSVMGGLRLAAELVEALAAGGAQCLGSVQRLVERVAVRPTLLQIALRLDAIGGAKEPGLMLEVPVQLKRCGMAVRLMVRSPGVVQKADADPKLVAILVKAQGWFASLVSGRSSSIKAIAEQEQVSASYVIRLIYLALLAPDLVHRIVTGEVSPELNADRLIRMGPLPMGWHAQRALLEAMDR